MIPLNDKTESCFYVLSVFLWKNLASSYFPVSPRLFTTPQVEQLPIPHPWHSKRLNVFLAIFFVCLKWKNPIILAGNYRSRMLLKPILFCQKKKTSTKTSAWNFLLCSSYLNSLFQNNPLFFCPLFFKIFLKQQVRIKKIAGENGVICHPTSPSGSKLKMHISIKPFGALQ